MTASRVRIVVGIYMLVFTATLVTYVTLAAGTDFLRIDPEQGASSILAVIIPTFTAQVAAVWQFYAGEGRIVRARMPTAIVLGPVVVCTLMALIVLVVTALGGHGIGQLPSTATIRNLFGFIAAIANITLVTVIGAYFKRATPSPKRRARSSGSASASDE